MSGGNSVAQSEHEQVEGPFSGFFNLHTLSFKFRT